MNRPLAPRSRRGYSLIEMLTVMSCMAVALTLTAGLLHQLLRVDRSERARVVAASSLERLAHDLRRDAHATTKPVERLDSRLVLHLDEDRSVEYLVRETDILRTVRQGEKTKGFEIYPRPTGTSARFELTQVDAVALIGLKVEVIAGKPADPVYRDYRIEAEPGRHARLLREVKP